MAKVIWIFNLFGGLAMMGLIFGIDAIIMALIYGAVLFIGLAVVCPEAEQNAKM